VTNYPTSRNVDTDESGLQFVAKKQWTVILSGVFAFVFESEHEVEGPL